VAAGGASSPVRSRIIATEPLSPNLMGELMPRRMMCSETRKLHYYYRPSPDGTRILFGGRDGTIAGDPRLADGKPAPRPGRHLPRAREDGDHAHVVRARRHEPRHDPTHLQPLGQALRRGVLRLRGGVGALGRRQGGAADPRRCRRRLRPRFPPAARGAVFNGKPWFMPAVLLGPGSRCRTSLDPAGCTVEPGTPRA
jgi:hypothetical protein